MKCKKCGYKLHEWEHYVELQDGTVLDESCFFDYAIGKLGGRQKQVSIPEESPIGCVDCKNYPCGHAIAGADARECDGYEKN